VVADVVYTADLNRADVVWNATLKKWFCCGTVNGSSTVDCTNPTTEGVKAPSPLALIATWSVLPAASVLASTTALATVTITSSVIPSQGVSPGAVTGIGVGAAFGGIAITALLGFLLWRRQAAAGPEVWDSTTRNAAVMPTGVQYEPKEMSSDAVPVELESGR
jgi:hypothetical protein